MASPFLTLGTGLGGFFRGYNEQQDAAQNRAIQQLRIQQYLEQQRDRQRQDQAASSLWGALSRGGDIAPSLPGATRIPQQVEPSGFIPSPARPAEGASAQTDRWGEPAPPGYEFAPGGMRAIQSGSQYSPAPAGMSSGLSDPRGLLPYIRERAQAYNIDPDIASRVASSEGLANPVGDRGTSFGAMQLHVGGGMGDEFRRDRGLDPSDPKNERQTIDYALSRVPQTGWTPFHGAARAGIGAREGIGQVQQQAQQTIQSAAQTIPPQVYGQMSVTALARKIEEANPSADPIVKMMALETGMKLLAPSERTNLQMLMMQNRQDFQRDMAVMRDQMIRDRKSDQPAAAGLEVLTDPSNQQQYLYDKVNRRATTLSGEPYTPGGAQKITGGGAGKISSQNIKVTDAEGKTVFSGSAHQRPGADGQTSWINDANQQRIEVPEGGSLSIAGKGDPGKQAAAQMVRLTTAANESRRQIANVARAAAGSTRSWFQGIQAETGSGLREGLGRALANQLTPRDEQFMSVLGLGLGRSLAGLETAGAATGLVNLQKTMQELTPQKGDTVETSLLKIAEMRQIAEQGIESAIAAPAVQDEQRKLLRSVMADIQKAVPWTVADVLDLTQNPGDETYSSFAAKIGLGGKAGAQPAGLEVGTVKGGFRFKGGNPADQSSWEEVKP